MELWIWLAAFAIGVLTFLLAIAWLAARGVILMKKLRPFAEHLVNFQIQARLYPEAVKLFSDLAKTQQTPARKPRNSKG